MKKFNMKPSYCLYLTTFQVSQTWFLATKKDYQALVFGYVNF